VAYVDGFIIPVPKAKLDAYKSMAKTGSEVWMELGAVGYVEAIGDDVPYGELTSFPRAVQASDDEVVVFSWIVYRDKASRDEIMAKVGLIDRRHHRQDTGQREVHLGNRGVDVIDLVPHAEVHDR